MITTLPQIETIPLVSLTSIFLCRPQLGKFGLQRTFLLSLLARPTRRLLGFGEYHHLLHLYRFWFVDNDIFSGVLTLLFRVVDATHQLFFE